MAHVVWFLSAKRGPLGNRGFFTDIEIAATPLNSSIMRFSLAKFDEVRWRRAIRGLAGACEAVSLRRRAQLLAGGYAAP